MKQLYLPEATSSTLFAVTSLGSPWELLWLWLVVVNVLTFLAFGLDKWKAKRKQTRPDTRRIPERNLFLSAIAGGSLGALLGMRVFHHKTLHRSFRMGIPAILIVQLVVGGVVLVLRAVR